MSSIDIDKWTKLWEYVFKHIGAVVLGLVIGISIAIALYQGILMPAKEAEIKAATAGIGAKGVPTTPTTKPCLRKAVVVFIDGFGKYAGYYLRDEKEGKSNAHYLVEEARKDESIVVKDPVIVPQTGKIDSTQIIDMHPDVVVIHRSTFDRISDDDPKQRLRDLISSLRTSSTVFLIYSRTPGTDLHYAADLAESAGTEGRVSSFQFRRGNVFDDSATVIYFLRHINTLARARVAMLDLKICDN
jgi:hypothetical protein